MKKLLYIVSILILLSNTSYSINYGEDRTEANADYMSWVAVSLIKTGDYENAEKIIKDAFKIQDNNSLVHYAQGYLYSELGKNDKAIKHLKKALLLAPENVDAHVVLGSIYVFQEKYEWAQLELEKAVQLDIRSPQAYYYLGDMNWLLNEKDTALHYYKKTIKYNSVHKDAHLKLGILYKEKKQNDLAKKHLETAIVVGITSDPFLYLNLGIVYGRLGNAEKEIQNYRKGLAINDEIADLHNNLAISLMKNGIYSDETIEHLLVAIELNHEKKENYYNLGNAYLNMNKLKLAHNAIEKALEIDGKYYEANMAMALILQKQNSINAASKYYEVAYEMNQSDIGLLINYGTYLMDIESYDNAIEKFKKVINIDPGNLKAHFNMGILYGILQKNSLAQKEFKKVLKLDSRNHEAYKYLGVLNAYVSNYKNAFKYYKKSMAINPSDPENYFNIAVLYEQKGNIKSALKYYLQVIEKFPKHPLAHNNVGVVHERLGYKYAAMRSFRRALELDPMLIHAYYNLAGIYEKSNRYSEAIDNYAKVLEISPKHRDARNRLLLVEKLYQRQLLGN
jgi:tetratricopeptide (TPR) repeat protein